MLAGDSNLVGSGVPSWRVGNAAPNGPTMSQIGQFDYPVVQASRHSPNSKSGYLRKNTVVLAKKFETINTHGTFM